MHRNLLGTLLAAGAACAVTCAAPASAQTTEVFPIALPEQDLASSLRQLSAQTGRSIVASGDLVRGRRAPAVSGSLTVEEAVRALVAGSGLAVRRVGGSLVIVGLGGGESPESAVLTGAPSQGGTPIVVTGTHLRGAPASSPVIVIDREEIDRSGATSVEQLMRKLPQNTQGGVNQENFEVALPDQDGTDHGAGLNLRGLGQRATLVLLNGRRMAPSGYGAYVDISLVPVSLIERVEILTDGASAIYGSDAVGGVVNFILRDSLNGLETSAHAGTTTRGGGQQLLLSQAGGLDWSGGHALLAYEYREEREVKARDRAFTINLNPDNFLLPREQRHSVLASVEQDLIAGLRIGATGSYAHRTTDRTFFPGVSPIAISAQAVAEAISLGSELSYDFGANWRARVEGTYALSTSDQQQDEPGGVGFVNSRGLRNEVFGGAIKADGPLFDLPGGSVRAALGVEVRAEAYRQIFEGSAFPRTVTQASRDVMSLFGELSVPLVSSRNRSPGLERLELSAAGRFDDYGPTGSAFDPKLGVLWSPVAGFDFRGSYGTSFRAPLLAETGGNYDVFYAPSFLAYQNPAQAPLGEIAAILQGSDPDIRPETSTTWSAGADFSPAFLPGLKLSFGYYAITFVDRIALPIRTPAVIGDPAYESIISRNPALADATAIIGGAQRTFDVTGPGFSNGGATPADVDILLDTRVSNTAETRTDGFDLSARYAFETGANGFVLEANLNHVLAFDDRITAASPVAQGLDRVFGPLAWRARGGVGWNRGSWTAGLFVNHAGDYADDRGAALVPIGSYTTADFSLSYTVADSVSSWLRGTRLSMFAENVTDAGPPRLLPEPGQGRGLGYDPVNSGGRGRFVSLQVRRAW
ncbi:MAG: hypothetical protein B7Z33_03195 [Sphingomonadales bacterium 12-68-11]|nr:MAG: hypothetical protein B7Z33_03195 [Sphingomonadales bacterium 12-68-11]OYX16874.1 MAG: hypothetical protein B7Z07_01675 [Sphingomonadales bacterium 32-67-7]